MEYSALYRKYRPDTFDKIIGQEHITTTLTNQIKSGKICHAYLFAGSRGTGKTSAAKVFARAVNCLSPINGSPCYECDVCKNLAASNCLDILEIDAASNNKADEIREIRERVKFMPSVGKYKVYIIDEVHMLSDSAFNALLKTLEEPPSHVIFILATTEIHKLPATIVSRCLRFDFRLVGMDTLSKHLNSVFSAENVSATSDAVRMIAAYGEGSVRDMLSIADICVGFSKNITADDVLFLLGASDRTQTAQLLSSIHDNNAGEILSAINEIAQSGKSMQLAAKELCKLARDILVVKTAADAKTVLAETDSTLGMLSELAEKYSADFLISLIVGFSAVDADLRYSVSPRIVFECAALSASRLINADIASLTERLNRVLENGVQAKASSSEPTSSAAAVENAEPARLEAGVVWGRLATRLRNSAAMSVYTLVSAHRDYEIRGARLVVRAAGERFDEFDSELTREAIGRALADENINLSLQVVRQDSDGDSEIDKIKKLLGVNLKIVGTEN